MGFEAKPAGARRKTGGRRVRRASAAPSCLLVDLDDTLFDHRGTARRGLRAFQERFPALRRRSLADLEAWYEAELDSTHEAVVAGSLSVGEGRARRMQALFDRAGERLSKAEAWRRGTRWRRLYQSLRGPVEGAPEFLRYVHRRAQVVIVSNNRLVEQREKLRFLGLDRDVDALITSEEVGVAKPDPALFRAGLAAVRADPSVAVVLGDSYRSDVLGARRSGIPVVWLNRSGRPAPRRVRPPPELRSLRPAATAWTFLVEAWRAGHPVQ